jgi:hypothetical protein
VLEWIFGVANREDSKDSNQWKMCPIRKTNADEDLQGILPH